MAAPKSKLLLTLVLVASKPGEKDYYAVVPFPETYEVRIILPSRAIIDVTGTHKRAIEAATKSLGRYIIDREGKDIILRCSMVNRVGDWIWADILPEDWKITVGRNRRKWAFFWWGRRCQSASSDRSTPFCAADYISHSGLTMAILARVGNLFQLMADLAART